jgi:hypothetical protein
MDGKIQEEMTTLHQLMEANRISTMKKTTDISIKSTKIPVETRLTISHSLEVMGKCRTVKLALEVIVFPSANM